MNSLDPDPHYGIQILDPDFNLPVEVVLDHGGHGVLDHLLLGGQLGRHLLPELCRQAKQQDKRSVNQQNQLLKRLADDKRDIDLQNSSEDSLKQQYQYSGAELLDQSRSFLSLTFVTVLKA